MSSHYVICDLEATGLHEEKEPIEIALITLKEDKVIDVFDSLIQPEFPASDFVLNLTSISKKDLSLAPKFYDLSERIKSRLEGAIFVSHNVEFDWTLLKKQYERMGQKLELKRICTLKMAQHLIPGLKNYNLDALCSFFGIKIKNRHRAIGDAEATVELFKELQNLRGKTSSKIYYLPQHEKLFKKMSSKPGLLKFLNANGKVIQTEACLNMEATARKLLRICPENGRLIKETSTLDEERTGSVLIAEFKKDQLTPSHPKWSIQIESINGMNQFKIRPFKNQGQGLWDFEKLSEAKSKFYSLKRKLKLERFAYREGPLSKEEILKHNLEVTKLTKEALFPADHLLIISEGRVAGERSFILIRRARVIGYGHTFASLESVIGHPENYLTYRFRDHHHANRLAKRHLRVMKNTNQKNEFWRSLPEHVKMPPSREFSYEAKQI
jgi:DNA polymerase-3 subunit epsilon